MKMYFREHRQLFEDSMKTIREIETFDELGDVVIQEYGYDDRLNSDTKIVIKDGYVLGFITFDNKRGDKGA